MVRLQYNLSDIPDFVTVKPGRYLAKLKSCIKANSRKGNPQLTWTWQLASGKQKGLTVRSWTSLQEEYLANLKQHLIAFGKKGKVSLNTDDLIGQTVIIVVAMQTGTGQNGQARDFPTVTAVLPKSAGLRVESTNDFDEDEDEDEAEEDDDEQEDEEDEDEEESDDDDEDEEEDEPVSARRNGKTKPVRATKRMVKAGPAKRRSSRRSDDDDDDDTPF